MRKLSLCENAIIFFAGCTADLHSTVHYWTLWWFTCNYWNWERISHGSSSEAAAALRSFSYTTESLTLRHARQQQSLLWSSQFSRHKRTTLSYFTTLAHSFSAFLYYSVDFRYFIGIIETHFLVQNFWVLDWRFNHQLINFKLLLF